jgi:hypothetical protein
MRGRHGRLAPHARRIEPPHDLQKIRGAAVDDEASIRALHAEHGGFLLRHALYLTAGNRHRAEELVHETIVRAWRQAAARTGKPPARPCDPHVIAGQFPTGACATRRAARGSLYLKQFRAGSAPMTEHRVRTRGSGGRKSKGPRIPCTVRFPVELHGVIMQAADNAGYDSFQDFMVDLAERALQAGLIQARPHQERLPASA